MSFQSKRLRLQLPCAEPAPADDAAAAHPTRDHVSRAADSLGPFSGDPWPDLGACGGRDEFETVLVTPQQLAVLRRRLEACLAPATGVKG